MSRLVTIPEHVIAMHPLTKKPIVKIDYDKEGKPKKEVDDDPWTEYRFLVQYVVNRPEWLKPLKKQREGGRILDLFEDVDPGSVVELSDEQWRKLRDTLEDESEETSFELPSHFGHQLVVFADAIINAPEGKVDAAKSLPAKADKADKVDKADKADKAGKADKADKADDEEMLTEAG